MKRIVADPERCMACRACEHACALAHATADNITDAVAEPRARTRVRLTTDRGVVIPLQCRHCENAPCIAACPEGAIARESPEAPVIIDLDKCVGHGKCVDACPFDAIRISLEEKVALKCDLCAERASRGLGPACVEACPTSTLALVERGEMRYEVDPEACRACLLCKKACPVQAISGERKVPHVIDQEGCMICGKCFQVCPFDAIRFRRPEPVGPALSRGATEAGK